MPRNDDDNKKMWVGAQLDEPIYNSLFRLSTEIGVHPSLAVELAVESYIENYVMKEADPDFAITQMSIKLKRRQHSIATIKQMAIAHLNDPTENSADQLAIACDSVGIDLESIIDVLSENEYIGQIVNERGKNLSEVEMWLVEMIKPGREYKASVMFEKAKEKGFSHDRIKKARLSLGIKSKRRSHNWVWFWPEGTVPTEEVPNVEDSPMLPGLHKKPPEVPF